MGEHVDRPTSTRLLPEAFGTPADHQRVSLLCSYRTPEQTTTLTTFRTNLVAAGLCPADPFAPEVIANGPG